MKDKYFYAVVILLLFLAIGIQPSRATIYLSDLGWSKNVGSWDPPTGTLTQDVSETIQITSDGITLDGAGNMVSVTWAEIGVDLAGRKNVTVTNVKVNGSSHGIWLSDSDNNTLTGNFLTGYTYTNAGIYLESGSNGNTITGNTVYGYNPGIWLQNMSVNNTIYHNNFFIDNTDQAYVSYDSSPNSYDAGDPAEGGNYWSNWTAPDADGNGIVDDPYVMPPWGRGQDNYPWVVENGWLDPDSDGDGLSDTYEESIGTDPFDPDSDNDGLWDGTEVEMADGTGCPDPLDSDSDDDTLLDGVEVDMGTSPCNVDSDGDVVPDNIDPEPTVPGVTQDIIEEVLRGDADEIRGLDLGLFSGPNNNANKGRRGALSNRANAAANQVADENYQEAIDILFSLLDRVDGVDPPKDWMTDSPERLALEIDMMAMIDLLGYFL